MVREKDASEALPRWWIASALGACIACIALFAIAVTLDSVAMGFAAILVLLLAATGLPIALRRQQQRQQPEEE